MNKVITFLLISILTTASLSPKISGGSYWTQGSRGISLQPGDTIELDKPDEKEIIFNRPGLRLRSSKTASFAELVTNPQGFINKIKKKGKTKNRSNLIAWTGLQPSGKSGLPPFKTIGFKTNKIAKLDDATLKQNIKKYIKETAKREKKVVAVNKKASNLLNTNQSLQQIKQETTIKEMEIKALINILIDKYRDKLVEARTTIDTKMQKSQGPIVAKINKMLKEQKSELVRIYSLADYIGKQVPALKAFSKPLIKQFNTAESKRLPLLKQHLLPILKEAAKDSNIAKLYRMENNLRTLTRKYVKKRDVLSKKITQKLAKQHNLSSVVRKQNEATEKMERLLAGEMESIISLSNIAREIEYLTADTITSDVAVSHKQAPPAKRRIRR